MRAGRQEIREPGCSSYHLFEVVEHEQQQLLLQVDLQHLQHRPRATVFDVERLSDGGHYQFGVADGSQIHEIDAVDERVTVFGSHLQSQASFSSARFYQRWSFSCFRDDSFVGQVYNQVWYAALVLLMIAQVYRYRTASSPLQRQQGKWLLFSGCVGVLIAVGLRVPQYLFPSLGQAGSFYVLVLATAYLVLAFIFPFCLGIAILRCRLWDIDIIIQRTLLYGMLTACVVALYVLVVVGLGALLQARGNLGISLLATGLIAVLIQPLHTSLQRAVNHLLYGERDELYQVISHLGQRLEAALAPEAVLPTIVETVTGALKLPYAAISLKQGGEDEITASAG